VAPKNQPQTELVLRKLQDLIKNDQVTPEMLKDAGMSKEELNQFVEKFSKAPKAEPGAGREIDVKPGKPQTIAPDRKVPDLNPNAAVSAETIRQRGGVVQDTERNNNEGIRFVPPPELRARFNGFRNTLSRPRTGAPARKAAPAAPGSGGK
jgi:hypothetical protein